MTQKDFQKMILIVRYGTARYELSRKIQNILNVSAGLRKQLMPLHENMINRTSPIYVKADIDFALHKIKD